MHINSDPASKKCAPYAHDFVKVARHKAVMDTEWFKAMKRDLALTDAQIGEALCVDRSVANKIMNGKVTFDARRAPALAALLKVPVAEIFFRTGITKTAPAESDHAPTKMIDAGETVDIKALDLSLSMGPGTLIEEFVEEQPVKFDIGLLRAVTRSPFASLRAVRGIGDSMEPTLRTNDRLIIDTSEKLLSRVHGIYWIDHLGAHGVKRLRGTGQGRMLIMSDNPAVADYEVAADEVRIHGRAIWLMRDL